MTAKGASSYDDESDVLEFKAKPKAAPQTQRFRLPPYLDEDGNETAPGEIVTAVEPKKAFLFNLTKMATSGALDLPADSASDDVRTAQARGQVDATERFIDNVFTVESAVVIRARLDSDDRNFDMDDLERVSDWLQGLWSSRPTGRRSGSGRSSKSTGRRSTVRAR